ncbi:hypothetical protein [Streptomyces sp. CC228A]|uniref:DUF7691 family protein n=1 Tax=Streptomyces sp. CC228A TaxID=2898186 RepID=UPI001F2AA3F2|nr:hypothetical protein [Streptomyces sp. CC228A]
MSYALSPYLVDIAKARAAIGSGDDKLRRMIGGRFKQQMAHADEWFADELAQGAPSRYEALRAVVAGGPFDAAHAFQYGYAYQMICEFHGRWLFNNDFSPFRSGWLERVDEGLREASVTAVAVTDFMYGSVPEPLPRPDFLPAYGEWTPDQCAEGLAQWEAAAPEKRGGLDPEVLAAVESCVDWMRQARAREGYGVVAFGH